MTRMDERATLRFFSEWGKELSKFAREEEGIALQDWPGFPGASMAEIAEWERENELRLPPSYRTFLEISNGWSWLGPSHLFGGALHPVRLARSLSESDPSLIAAYQCPISEDLSEVEHRQYDDDMDPTRFRRSLLSDAIQISEAESGGVYLLVPTLVTAEGEWEAWNFSDWRPGALRYPSFMGLMIAERQRLANIQRGRATRR